MSADKFVKLQSDVRNNQADVQSFLRDLNSWETSIKRKDEVLKTGDTPQGEKNLPPVRNVKGEVKKKRKKKKPQDDKSGASSTSENLPNGSSETAAAATEQGNKIRAYDYRSWDKFDVDAACAAVDSDDENKERGKEEEEEYETDSDAEREEMEIQRRIMEASAEKEKGNSLFKKGDYDAAVACYTKGLEADQNNALLSANRAMALLKLKRYEEAEKDCDKALSLDFTYVKAYARRGTARLELGRLEDAKKDFEQVLNIETDNKQAKNEIKRIERLLKEREEEREEERKRAQEPANAVHAVHKPPHLRSTKPLKRMVIQEVGKGVAEERQRERERLMAEKQRTEKMEKDGESEKRTSDATSSSGARIQEVKSRTDASAPENNADAEQNPVPRKKGNSPRGKGKSPSGKGKSQAALPSKPAVPGIPSSSFQLQADWKRLKGHPDVMFEYFKKIPPASYPKLFQNSLDSAMLSQILLVLKESYIPTSSPVFETLEKLSTVKRFDMNIMFMSSKEKQVVRELFDQLKSEGVDEQSCQQLAKTYGL